MDPLLPKCTRLPGSAVFAITPLGRFESFLAGKKQLKGYQVTAEARVLFASCQLPTRHGQCLHDRRGTVL